MSGLMQILLLKVSAHITEQLGMAPGGEFREAFKEVTHRRRRSKIFFCFDLILLLFFKFLLGFFPHTGWTRTIL